MKLRDLFGEEYETVDLQRKNLSTLEGQNIPEEVSGDFFCANNNLTSLAHCPKIVKHDFDCSANNLSSLKDIHKQIKKVGGDFWCINNPIKSHILGLMLIEVDECIHTRLGNGSDVDEILNKWKNQGGRGALGAQRELLDLGYEELARL